MGTPKESLPPADDDFVRLLEQLLRQLKLLIPLIGQVELTLLELLKLLGHFPD